jgi:hypothetical protein
MTKALLQLYDAANAPLAPGSPPLTRESADCYMDMMTFIQAEVMNMAARSLPQEIREAWFHQLISEYPGLPDPVRAFIGDTPLKWRHLQASWPQIPAPEKERYRQEWAKEFGLARPQPYQSTYVPQPPSDIRAPMNNRIVNPTPGYYKGPSKQETPGADKLEDDIKRIKRELLEAQEKGDSDVVANLQVELQDKLQKRQVRLQMMSNINKMNHDCSMAIIGNMR